MTDAPQSRRARRAAEDEAADRGIDGRTLDFARGVATGEIPAVDADGSALSRRDRRRLERLASPMETWTAEEERLATGQIPIVSPQVIAAEERAARERADAAARDAYLHSQEFRRVADREVRPERRSDAGAPPAPGAVRDSSRVAERDAFGGATPFSASAMFAAAPPRGDSPSPRSGAIAGPRYDEPPADPRFPEELPAARGVQPAAAERAYRDEPYREPAPADRAYRDEPYREPAPADRAYRGEPYREPAPAEPAPWAAGAAAQGQAPQQEPRWDTGDARQPFAAEQPFAARSLESVGQAEPSAQLTPVAQSEPAPAALHEQASTIAPASQSEPAPEPARNATLPLDWFPPGSLQAASAQAAARAAADPMVTDAQGVSAQGADAQVVGQGGAGLSIAAVQNPAQATAPADAASSGPVDPAEEIRRLAAQAIDGIARAAGETPSVPRVGDPASAGIPVQPLAQQPLAQLPEAQAPAAGYAAQAAPAQGAGADSQASRYGDLGTWQGPGAQDVPEQHQGFVQQPAAQGGPSPQAQDPFGASQAPFAQGGSVAPGGATGFDAVFGAPSAGALAFPSVGSGEGDPSPYQSEQAADPFAAFAAASAQGATPEGAAAFGAQPGAQVTPPAEPPAASGATPQFTPTSPFDANSPFAATPQPGAGQQPGSLAFEPLSGSVPQVGVAGPASGAIAQAGVFSPTTGATPAVGAPAAAFPASGAIPQAGVFTPSLAATTPLPQAKPATGAIPYAELTPTGQLAALRRAELPDKPDPKTFAWPHLGVIAALMVVLGVVIYNVAFGS